MTVAPMTKTNSGASLAMTQGTMLREADMIRREEELKGARYGNNALRRIEKDAEGDSDACSVISEAKPKLARTSPAPPAKKTILT